MSEGSDRGIVFDIQRASLHDGPGIRTTVFLKGCPLHCQWCHNPEGISGSPQLFFLRARCVGCWACAKVCPNGVHRFFAGEHILDAGRCELCGQCIEQCHYGALKIIGTEMSVEEVLNEVLADIDFYRNSGGGVTLSGGEPLLQLEFALALLEQSKEAGIHTCVETCGYLLSERFVRALPLTDLLLFDYKVTGRARHRLFTGAGNELILENLDLAYKAGVPTVLRCPVIPGLNDCLEHFQGIRDIAQRYPLLKGIEIMPYHKLGVGKRESIGAGSATPEWGAADGGMKDHWVKQLRELGCNNAS